MKYLYGTWIILFLLPYNCWEINLKVHDVVFGEEIKKLRCCNNTSSEIYISFSEGNKVPRRLSEVREGGRVRHI